MNLSFYCISSWCNSSYYSNCPVESNQHGKKFNKFCPSNRIDDLCLFFCLYPSSMTGSDLHCLLPPGHCHLYHLHRLQGLPANQVSHRHLHHLHRLQGLPANQVSHHHIHHLRQLQGLPAYQVSHHHLHHLHRLQCLTANQVSHRHLHHLH